MTLPATLTPDPHLADAAVHLADLVRTFPASGRHARPVRAVRGVDLTIRRGEVVALLGPNGAGKSTTIEMILGLVAPTSGAVTVFGAQPAEAVARRRVAAVMQSGGLLPGLTVGETLQIGASLTGDTAGEVDRVARRAGLAGLLRRRVGACSGGEQQRLRFALALLPDPDLLILDEPTTGLDVGARRAFWDAIRADAGSGRTILFATHYLQEADDHADRVVLMSRGQIVADGTPAQVKSVALGRTVTATLPDAHDVALAARDEVQGLTRHGPTVRIATTDSDALARHLLTRTEACDVEIASHALDEAFLTLTTADTTEEDR